MTEKDIAQWAWDSQLPYDYETNDMLYLPQLTRFAELVRKDYSTTHANLWLDRIHKFMLAEREACAKLCEDAPEPDGKDLAERIRARGDADAQAQ